MALACIWPCEPTSGTGAGKPAHARVSRTLSKHQTNAVAWSGDGRLGRMSNEYAVGRVID